MAWSHLLVASDNSPAGLHAVEIARALARAAGTRLSVVTVVPSTQSPVPAALSGRGLQVAYGLPGIEIVRVAEEVGADLIVLGRTTRGSGSAPRLGPTADAVVRRSDRPCLFVPLGQERFGHLLVALDGTERGLAVFERAREFLALAGGDLEAVFVDTTLVPAGTAGPSQRTLRILQALQDVGGEPGRPYPFRVVSGEPAAGIRTHLHEAGRDLLVIGARRGGPAGIPRSTGVGRTLLYTAPCAVLTIPL